MPAFTGVSDPYEPPADADIVVDTTRCTSEEAAESILERLRSEGYLPPITASVDLGSTEAGSHCRDVGPDEFELLDLSDGHLDRATPSGPARPSGE